MRIYRLYGRKKTAPDVEAVLGDYVKRWMRWTKAGLNGMHVCGVKNLIRPAPGSSAQELLAQAPQHRGPRICLRWDLCDLTMMHI